MEWVEEFTEAGIDDVHRLDLIVPVEDVEAAVVRMLPEIKAQGSSCEGAPKYAGRIGPCTSYDTFQHSYHPET